MGDSNKSDKTIGFISDWQERSLRQQRKFIIILAISLFFAIIICDIGFYWFQGKNQDRIINQNLNYLQDSALQEANDVERNLDNSIRLINKFSNQYATLERDFPSTTIEDRLKLLWDRTLFDRIAYVDPLGEDFSLEGQASIADREYFQSAMNGESGYVLLEESRVTNRPALVFYAPIYTQSKEISGVMLGFYERERIDEQLSYEFLNYTPNTYLLRGDGLVIGSSHDEYRAVNMFDILKSKTFTGEVDYKRIQEAISDESRTSVTFTFVENGKISIGVISQFTNSDMMILSVMPNTVMDTMIAGANRSGTVLMLFMTIAFLLLIVLFMVFLIGQWRRMKLEMTLATKTLHETLLHDQKQTHIVESLGNTYSSVYYVDVISLKYLRIKEDEVSVQSIPNEGNWYDGWAGYVQEFVDQSFQGKMLQFYDIFELIKKIVRHPVAAEYQRSDKKWRKAFFIPAEIDENGKVSSLIFAVQQIEEQKQQELETQEALKQAYEAAQLASNAKTIFLSNISHDIRTPMNAIVGMTAIAGSNLNNQEKVADCLKKINVASKHLLGIINEVLDMSKIETGKVDLSEEEFNLPNVFDELISINQPLIKEKKHSLSVTIQSIDHENVIGDSTRLQQVFTNLLTNAIKYTPEGGKLEIIVSEKPTNKPNIGWYEVIFKDNGIGIAEEDQARIFEPFTRARDNRITGIQGTGLGMPIARNIIRMMNGDIKLESKVNVGSTFTVSFALRLQSESAVDYASFVNLPVLVVDDNLVACESTCAMLESLSMKSEYVLSGREAVVKVVDHHQKDDDYYAVILDWQMPDMDGVMTAKEIRSRVGNDIPIIVISAYDWSEIEGEARKAGVNAFLSKPLFRSKLVNLFSELVGNHQAEKVDAIVDIQKNNFSGKRILLAEDNELNQEIAIEIFSMMGLETEVAENGKICYEKFTQSEPGYYDLIFMDIQMPIMNGHESSLAIRASTHADAKTIPIIAMSANAFSTDVRASIEAGMNDHIAKPIDISKIVKVLKEYIKS